MEEADLILVMNQDMLKTLPPEKTHVLKPFFGIEGNIDDPWPDEAGEKAAQRYDKCAAELRAVLEKNINKLINTLRPAPYPGIV
jgi:protein-tyrosine-phosphatase